MYVATLIATIEQNQLNRARPITYDERANITNLTEPGWSDKP